MFNEYISGVIQEIVQVFIGIVLLQNRCTYYGQKRQLNTFYYLLGMTRCVFTITCLIVGSMHRFQKICYVVIVFILLAAQLAVCSTSSKYTNIPEITKKTFLKRHAFVFFCIIHVVIVFIYVEGSYQQSQAVCKSHEINTELSLTACMHLYSNIHVYIDYYMAFSISYPLSARGRDISTRADRLKG